VRKDVRQFIRRLEAVGLTVESAPGHYRVLQDGKPLRKANGMPLTLPFSPAGRSCRFPVGDARARLGRSLLAAVIASRPGRHLSKLVKSRTEVRQRSAFRT
jgi:hypothetical protein